MKKRCIVKDERKKKCKYIENGYCGIHPQEYFKRKSDLFSPIPHTLCNEMKERGEIKKDIYDVLDEGHQ